MKKWALILILLVWPLYLTDITWNRNDTALDNLGLQLDSIVNKQRVQQGQIEENWDTLRSEMTQTLDLSVLDSCGIITNGQGHGSCVAIRPNLMLTAGHCIGIGGTWIEVDGQQYRILKQWKSEQYDVGFVGIEGELPFVELGQMPELLQDVWLVGAPDSTSLVNTITSGIISQVHVDYMSWKDIIVSDTFSWPGNSGGPLFCEKEGIVGICVSGPDSLNVAESVEHIRRALEEYDARGE